jgi:hypothetical protein
MTESKTYSGGCHCGKVRYEVTLALGEVMACNCSMCSKRGTLLTFVGTDQFKLLAGENDVTDYQFNKHIIHHLFCKTCGILSFARGVGPGGKPTVAINARCLDDVDAMKLPTKLFDGKKL